MPSRIDTLIAKCASWDDFVLLANNQQDNKFKGDLFERLTQVFLQTSSTYVSKLKNVWWCNNNELPENIRKKLRLPIADEGIDLICETVEGEFWSVQCKYKANQNQPLTHKELSTFTSLSFNTATDIVLGLVVHTSTKKVRKSNLMTNVTELGLEKWLGISKEDWKRIRTVCRSNKLLPPKKRKPRKHQKAAIEDAVHHYSVLSKSRGKLIMPCGTGKSLTAFWIAQALKSKSIIVAVPSLTLVRDSLADWTAEFLSHGIKPNWIAVCSDYTVGATADADSTVATVYETGIPTTTDKQKIQKFLERKSKLPKIVFTTYQSGQKLCDATNGSSIKFDLLICDEAHKTVGSPNKAFAALLFDENVSAKHRIFMTATERIYRQRKDDVVSMDDPNVYGEVFHELSFKEAIKQKIICDYKILTIAVTANEAKALIENNEGLRVADGKDSFETDAHNLSVGLTLQKVFRKYKIKHAVSFHSSIKRAKFFSDQQGKLSTKREIKNYHVSSKHSAGERARILRNFANDNLSLISNARCLTEGVDIPSIDCVVFADPKQSTVDIVQAAGRAMRQSKSTGKEHGYILLPLIIPQGDDLRDFADQTKFKNIIKVITSLSTQDERIAEQMRAGVEKKSSVPSDIVQIETAIFDLMDIKTDDLDEAINARVWSSVGRANWRKFEEARKFIRSLKLSNEGELRQYYTSGDCPPDIPKNPSIVYRHKGWKGLGDYLGTFRVATRDVQFLPYEAAVKFARKNNLKSYKDWAALSFSGNLPANLPSLPSQTYKGKGWINWGVFFGTGKLGPGQKKWMTYKDSKKFIQQQNLKSLDEFRAWCKSDERHPDIPTSPDKTYPEFENYVIWLGTGNFALVKGKDYFRPFIKARSFVRGLNLRTSKEWRDFAKTEKRPSDIPASPERVYKENGWVSFPDWLGTNVKSHNEKWMKFSKARSLARKLGLAGHKEWVVYSKSEDKPRNIPVAPHDVYGDKGWLGYGDWLGTQNIQWGKKEFYSFEEGRKVARKLGLKTHKEWMMYCASDSYDPQLPMQPASKYKNSGWRGVGDWLGTGKVSDNLRKILSYKEARNYARGLGLKYASEWREHVRSQNFPEHLVVHPERT
ncbi:DEAD/DEAH box helicase family protein, partial [Alphaproteobacteria bacterium]|nr:DEAD/DEAH box helicase family protein [Alphaproteobacteria bacterium]